MANIVNPQITDASPSNIRDDPALRLQTELANAAIASIKLAMQNAVSAQQRLNEVGVAALTQTLARRLEAKADAAGNEAAQAAEPRAQGALADDKGIVETVRASVVEANRLSLGPELLLEWSRAFAMGLALVDAATSQHMRDIIGAVLMAQVRTEGSLSASDAILLQDLLNGNAVAETLAALNAAIGSAGGKT